MFQKAFQIFQEVSNYFECRHNSDSHCFPTESKKMFSWITKLDSEHLGKPYKNFVYTDKTGLYMCL